MEVIVAVIVFTVVFVFLMTVLAFVEGIPLSIGLRIPYRRTLKVLLAANGVSLIAGFIPVAILNTMLFKAYMPHPLAAYFRAYPLASALGSLIFFIVAVMLEFGVVALWCRKQDFSVGWKKLMLIVFIMNAVTHAVIAPLNYWAKRPRHDVKVFTDDSSWAQHPLTEIYYISTNGNLCAIMTDGSNQRVVIPGAGKDVAFNPEGKTEVYGRLNEYHYGWSGEGEKMHFHRDKNEHISVTASIYIGSGIRIEQGDDKWRIADDPGLMLFSSNRRFRDVYLLENGQECIFTDDKNGIYLVNIAERKVGQITSGEGFFTLTPRYRRNLGESEKL
jgi:hypothetical protein